MSIGARLLTRLLHGRRVLQLLAGLSLIALAFATPALAGPPAPPAPALTVVTGDALACADLPQVRTATVPALCAETAPTEFSADVPDAGAGRLGDHSTEPGGVAQRPPAGRAPPLL
ncbi:hypothetical protein [Actinoplanes sp. NPDC051859]|uniref:hypothetical protein n=1 Tax=Actinoplanes sp. NPDC051859 TaxID=3363909 RepID=UPI00378FF8D1